MQTKGVLRRVKNANNILISALEFYEHTLSIEKDGTSIISSQDSIFKDGGAVARAALARYKKAIVAVNKLWEESV